MLRSSLPLLHFLYNPRHWDSYRDFTISRQQLSQPDDSFHSFQQPPRLHRYAAATMYLSRATTTYRWRPPSQIPGSPSPPTGPSSQLEPVTTPVRASPTPSRSDGPASTPPELHRLLRAHVAQLRAARRFRRGKSPLHLAQPPHLQASASTALASRRRKTRWEATSST